MTGALLEKPVCQPPLLDGGGTLEEVLASAIREAQANGITDCPVCGARGRMSSTRAGAREAECSGCGSRLS
jgi:hypothetical protein